MENENIEISVSSEDLKEKQVLPRKNIMILDKTIKWCIYIFIALLPLWFLPFTENVLSLNKQVLMIGLLTIALIAWLGKLLTQEKIEWYKGLILVFFLVFLVVYGVATIFSLRPYDSLMGFDTHLSRSLINLIYFFIFFLLLINYKEENQEKKNIKIFKLLTIFLVSSAIAGIVGLLQILGGFIFPWDFTKIASFNTVGTTTSLGILLASILPLVLSLIFIRFSARGPLRSEASRSVLGWKIFLISLAVLSLVIILLLNFRILWIITAIGMVLIIGFWLNKRDVFSTRGLNWLVIPVIILALCLVFLFFKPGLTFKLDLPIELGLSYKGGINVVEQVVQRSPILGSGPETFVYNYSLYKPESINQTIFWNLRFTNAPSQILTLLAETGILGLLAFLAVIVVFVFTMIKDLINRKNSSELSQLMGIKIGLFAGWIALMIGWFLYPQNITLMFVFWLFFTLLIIISSKKKDIKTINLKASNKIASVITFSFIILIIVVVGLLYLEGSKFMAEAKYKSGLNSITKGELNSGINKVVQATTINPYEDKFYRNLAQLFLIQINQDLNNLDLNDQERANRIQTGISNAINSTVRATTLNPKDVTNWIIRGSVYRNLIPLIDGAGDWAVTSYEQALTLEPINPFIYTEIARIYMAMGDDYLDKTIEAYNKAIELKPNYPVAHFELALVHDQQGEINEAIVRMENSLLLAPRDTGIIFQLGVLYYKSSQFEKAKAAFIQAIVLDTNFSNARYLLGLLYDREDNKKAAIEQFEKIDELNPDNDLVKQILANLRAGRPALGSTELGPPKQPEKIPIEENQPEEIKPRLPN